MYGTNRLESTMVPQTTTKKNFRPIDSMVYLLNHPTYYSIKKKKQRLKLIFQNILILNANYLMNYFIKKSLMSFLK